jgi:hypothetical protein
MANFDIGVRSFPADDAVEEVTRMLLGEIAIASVDAKSW